MRVCALVLAAGQGVRLGSKLPKPLIKIDSHPVITYSLLVLNRHPAIREIILVVNAKNKKDILRQARKYKINKIKAVVNGGLRRQDSVANGLKAVGDKAEIILIHDSARPFIDRKMVSAVIDQARKSGAAILGVPLKATVKSVKVSKYQSIKVEKTLDRDKLWEIQTPQVFKKHLILKAYERFGKNKATDDAMLVEKLGHRVSVVLGSYKNIKITTPEDLSLAEVIARGYR